MTDTGAGGAGGAGGAAGIDDGVCDDTGTCIQVVCRTATQDIDCDDGNPCTDEVCDTSTTPAGVCSNPPNDANTCADCEDGPPCKCSDTDCIFQRCDLESDPDAFCDDGNECTVRGQAGSCLGDDGRCDEAGVDQGTPCASGTGTCDGAGACIDNCAAQGCVAGDPDCAACADTGGDGDNPCTDNVCTSGDGTFTCSNPANDANSCNPGDGTCDTPPCSCVGGVCITGLTCPPVVADATGIPMACRNSFNDAVSTFPIDLLNVTPVGDTPDPCIFPGQPFDTTIDPTIALDTAFLEAAAQTLCDLGTFLSEADVTSAQVSIDAIAGATCTEQLAVLPDTPVKVPIASTLTCVGGTNEGDPCTVLGTECQGGGTCNACGSGGITAVTRGIALPLPAVTLPCSSAGTAGSLVQICSTGTVPLSITLTDPPPPPAYTQTYVGVSVGGGQITVAFACNTSSTTNPPPGQENDIGCILPNPSASTPNGLSCGQEVGDGNVGEEPFPTSDCNLADGPPIPDQTCDIGAPITCTGTCETVPVGVDPADWCATFTVQRCRNDADCGGTGCNTSTGACD
jgi:hypothetical protein